MKYTPGPWNWDSDPIKGDPLGRVRYRVTTIGKTITQCYYSSGDEQAEWDARLIAAAPTLLGALQMARAVLEIEGYEATGSSLQIIDAAIAKATTGEQQ